MELALFADHQGFSYLGTRLLRSLIVLFLFAVGAVGVPQAGSTVRDKPVPLFPLEVTSGGGLWTFSSIAPPPLWTSDALNGYRERIRFLRTGSRVLRRSGTLISDVAITLDQKANGKVLGTVVEADHRNVIKIRHFNVDPAKYEELKQLAASAGLWKIHPQFFVEESGAICIDGEVFVFETRGASGYRYSEGNVPCTLGKPQLAVALKMADLSEQSEVRSLIDN